jgi:cytochrome P450
MTAAACPLWHIVLVLLALLQVWLPPQTPLFACIHAYQRDPDFWPLAEQFRPQRWLHVGAAFCCPHLWCVALTLMMCVVKCTLQSQLL